MRGTLGLLRRNRDFRNMFIAELVVFGSEWFVMIPLLVLLAKMTGSGRWGGLVLGAETGLVALCLPYAGTVADRIDRKKIMITANIGAIIAGTLLLAVRGPRTVWIAVLAVGGIAVARAFYSPAAQAALPNLVEPEDLPTANAVAGSAWGTMLVVGASLGGVVSGAVGPYASFGIAAGCLVIAVFLVMGVRRPFQQERDGTEPKRAFAALVEALGYIRRRPTVLALVTVKSAVGMGNGVLAVLPILAANTFGLGALGTGLLYAARGVGALTGPLLMRGAVLRRPSRLLTALAISMAAYGFAYIGVGLAPWLWLAAVLVAVAHLGGGGNWAMSNYALQLTVPDELRGRIFATDMMIAMGAVTVSHILAGTLTDYVSPGPLIACFGAVTLTYAIVWRLATARLRLPAAQPA